MNNPVESEQINSSLESKSNKTNFLWTFKHTARNHIARLTQKVKEQPRILLFAVLILVDVFLGLWYFGAFDKLATQQFGQEAGYLDKSLRVLSAQIGDGPLPSQVTVQFNYPVDIHSLDHTATFAPNVDGSWEALNESKTTFIYKFDKKFKGTYFSIQINNELMSLDGRRMVREFSQYFNIASNAQYSDARVKSFAQGQPIPFIYTENEVSVYKSDAQKLLEYLTYKHTGNNERGSKYEGQFVEKYIEHQESQKITNLAVDIEKNTISLDPGIYFVDDNTSTPYFIVVNTFGAVLRQDDKKIVFGAFNLDTGAKLEGTVTFGLYNLNQKVTRIKDFIYSETNDTVSFAYPDRLDAVIGIYKDEVFFIPVEVYTSSADIKVSSNLETDSQIFLYTDRPIYKPGDTVFVKGIVRLDSDSLYKVPAQGSKVYLQLLKNSNSQTKPIQVVTTDEFGSFNAHFVLPKDYVGEYSDITADLKPLTETNYGSTYANFSVVRYSKPEFEIKTNVEKPEYLQSESLTFNISGNYFDNKPLANKTIKYEMYSDVFYEVEKAVYNQNFNISADGMCGGGGLEDYFGRKYTTGTVTLDDSGRAVVQTPWDKESNTSQKITLIAKITDTNNNELISAVNTIVHASTFNIFFIPSAENYNQGEEVIAPFYAENLTGEKVTNKEFSYKLIEYTYNNQEKKETVVLEGQTNTDSTGKGIVRFTLPNKKSTGYAELILSAADSGGNVSRKQKNITIVDPELKESVYNSYWGSGISQTYLKIQSNKNSFVVGDTVSLNINSPKEVDVLFSLERGRIYEQRHLHLQKGDNTVEFKISPELSPSITAVFSFFSEGNYYTEGLSLNIPAMHKLLSIDLALDKKQYTTSDQNAELKISARDADGYPVVTQMSVGVVDKAIYTLRESATPKIHTAYYYFRPRRTNASSSLTRLGFFEGGGGGGGGGESLGKAADVLYWNPNLRTDSSGNATISIPLLGQQTIWKVQVLGSTVNAEVGQAHTEFTVTK